MAQLHDVPGCCTMKIIVGLGETTVAGGNARRATEGEDLSVAGIRQSLTTLETQARNGGNAIVLAATNDEQTDAVEALRASGYARSRWAEKTHHPETRVRLWHKRLNPNGV